MIRSDLLYCGSGGVTVGMKIRESDYSRKLSGRTAEDRGPKNMTTVVIVYFSILVFYVCVIGYKYYFCCRGSKGQKLVRSGKVSRLAHKIWHG